MTISCSQQWDIMDTKNDRQTSLDKCVGWFKNSRKSLSRFERLHLLDSKVPNAQTCETKICKSGDFLFFPWKHYAAPVTIYLLPYLMKLKCFDLVRCFLIYFKRYELRYSILYLYVLIKDVEQVIKSAQPAPYDHSCMFTATNKV